MCSSARSFHHKSVFHILITPFLCILFCSSLSVHCVLHFVLSPIVCGHLFFSASALSVFSLQVPSASGYRPAPVVLPYLSPTCVKVGYTCLQFPAVFLSHQTISDNLSELLPVPFFVFMLLLFLLKLTFPTISFSCEFFHLCSHRTNFIFHFNEQWFDFLVPVSYRTF